jgi:HD-GYP domain-containing protein (c-di-GMP phosphodiesterase class II)
LEQKVDARTRQLHQAQKLTLGFYDEVKRNFESTMEVLSIAIDQRDPLTASHSFRVTEYALEIGKCMGLPEIDLEKLRYAGLMHDLGKIEIKEEILRKEGSLTTEEYQEIQTHARGTFTLLSKFKFKNGLVDVPTIASSHHERFDGNGYPRALRGENIPLLARVLAVADVLDAITSKRHYRSAMSIQNALAIMKREAGGHFDPACITALFKINVGNFVKIHMAEHLSKLDAMDLVALEALTLDELFTVCNQGTPTSTQMEQLRTFHKYYQGPVPVVFEGKIEPAPRYEDPHPSSSDCANC